MYKAIVVGTDGSPTARIAVDHAAQLAALTGATLHLTCVRRPEAQYMGVPEMAMFASDGSDSAAAAQAVLDEAATDVARHGVILETHAPLGSPASCLVEVAESVKADLLVVGSRGMHGARRVVGSVPNSITHHAPCNVLVVQTD